MEFPKVAILLPVYNPNLNYLKEQLDSISLQTYKNYLCLLSLDGPVNIDIEQLVSTYDSRFILTFQEKRLGLYLHIEKLFKESLSNFEFIATADQDDIWHSNRLEQMVKALKESNASMLTSNAFLLKDNSIQNSNLFNVLSIQSQNQKFALLVNHATGAGSIYRTRDFQKSVPFPINVGPAVHDHWLYIWGSYTNGCIFLTEPNWIYRQHEANQIGVTRVIGMKKLKILFVKLFNILFSKLRNSDPVISQLIYNAQSLLKRTESEAVREKIKDALSLKESLNPANLKKTRLESFRLLINFQKIQKFKLF